MNNIICTRASGNKDLQGILGLQQANLLSNLSKGEIESQGFVTAIHNLDILLRMNAIEPHIIARDGSLVVAYLLCMTGESRPDVPVLEPMFRTLEEIEFNGKKISDQTFITVGQACVGKGYRGIGLFDQCYSYYREQLSPRYAFAITEIDYGNPRSIKAHQRVGFREVHRYQTPDHTDWSIVLWDWKSR
jgi:hypothetical protein